MGPITSRKSFFLRLEDLRAVLAVIVLTARSVEHFAPHISMVDNTGLWLSH